MSKNRLILINENLIWNPNRRYKINAVVSYLGISYQNNTGINSQPDTLIDWQVIVVKNTRTPSQITTYSGVSTFTIPDGAIVNSVMLVRALLYEADEWTQIGNVLTITKTMTIGNRIQINFY